MGHGAPLSRVSMRRTRLQGDVQLRSRSRDPTAMACRWSAIRDHACRRASAAESMRGCRWRDGRSAVDAVAVVVERHPARSSFPPVAGAGPRRRAVADDLLRAFVGGERRRPIASSISRLRAHGRPTTSTAIAQGMRERRRPTSSRMAATADDRLVRARARRSIAELPPAPRARPDRGDRGRRTGANRYWALAHSAGQARFPRPRLLRLRACRHSEPHEIRHRTAARRPRAARAARRQARRAGRASGLGDARPDPLPRRARRAAANQRSPPRSGRSTGCGATSRTIWSRPRTRSIRSTESRCSASTARCAARPGR